MCLGVLGKHAVSLTKCDTKVHVLTKMNLSIQKVCEGSQDYSFLLIKSVIMLYRCQLVFPPDIPWFLLG